MRFGFPFTLIRLEKEAFKYRAFGKRISFDATLDFLMYTIGTLKTNFKHLIDAKKSHIREACP